MSERKEYRSGVIGWPIGHSLSPVIHTHWFDQYKVAGQYNPYGVEPDQLKTAVDKLVLEGLCGWNVTVPHKEAIMPYLDKIAPMAKKLGAVNTVVVKDGQTIGFNTDITGFKKQLDQSAPRWRQEKPVLIVGAGGAARAAVAAFLTTSVPFIMVANRTRATAEKLAADIGQGRVTVVDWDDRNTAVAGAGVVVNTTSLGMAGQPPLNIDLSSAETDTVIYDIVYKPLMTDFLKQGQDLGLPIVDGLGMLVYQAAGAFKLWFDIDPEYDAGLKKRLEKEIK